MSNESSPPPPLPPHGLASKTCMYKKENSRLEACDVPLDRGSRDVDWILDLPFERGCV